MTEFIVAALPLLVLLVALLLGRYPGCEAALRFADRIASRASATTTRVARTPLPRPPIVRGPHGGLLIAFGLAQRPPPLAA